LVPDMAHMLPTPIVSLPISLVMISLLPALRTSRPVEAILISLGRTLSNASRVSTVEAITTEWNTADTMVSDPFVFRKSYII